MKKIVLMATMALFCLGVSAQCPDKKKGDKAKTEQCCKQKQGGCCKQQGECCKKKAKADKKKAGKKKSCCKQKQQADNGNK